METRMANKESSDDINLNNQDDETESQDYLLYLEGALAASHGNYEQAYPLLSKSAELHPHFKTYEYLYTTLKGLGKPDEAFSYLKKAYNLNSKNNKTATMYANELVARDKVEEAKKILNEILQRSSTYGPARKLLEQLNTK